MSPRARTIASRAFLTIAILLGGFAGYQSWHQTRELTERQTLIEAMWGEQGKATGVIREDGEMVLWSPEMRELTGYTRKEINRLGVEVTMTDPKIIRAHAESVRKAFESPTHKTTVVNCEMLNKQGDQVPVRLVIRMLETDRHHYAIVSLDLQKNVLELGKPSAIERR